MLMKKDSHTIQHILIAKWLYRSITDNTQDDIYHLSQNNMYDPVYQAVFLGLSNKTTWLGSRKHCDSD